MAALTGLERRRGPPVVRIALVGFALAAIGLATPGVASAAVTKLEVGAPAHAEVGRPFELTLRASGAANVAGFEAQLLWGIRAAEFSSVDYRLSSLEKLGGAFGELGPVELPDGVAFGSYTCPSRACRPRALASPGRGVGGTVLLARVRILPLRPGRLEFRLSGELVAPDGSLLPLARGGNRTVSVQVGSRKTLLAAGAARPLKRPAHPRVSRIHDVSGDRRLSEQDVTEASLKWIVAREDSAVCGDSQFRALDANRDGCLDVADVQAYAGKVATRSPVALTATTINPALVVNGVGDVSDTAPGDGLCQTAAGTCTLRSAIEEANAEPGANEIDFAIPGTDVQTIQLGTELPTLSDTSGPTTIDGYTQPGASPNTDQYASNAQIMVQVRGTGSSTIDALPISSADNVVTGIAFFNLRHAIWLHGQGSRGNSIRGDFVGTNAAGTFGFGAADFNLDAIGIEFSAGANNNRIGEPTLAARNVISGNARQGMSCYWGASNLVYNNIIGLSPLGDRRLMNVYHGADWNAQCTNNVVGGTGTLQRNIISGNGVPNDNAGEAGVEISHGPSNTGNQIVGNCFGTDVTCTSSPPWTFNSFWGIHVEDTASNSVISNNVIVSSRNGGIKLEGGSTSGNTMTNNLIGVGPDGRALPNGAFGVLLADRASANVVGPGNVIANNPVGVWVRDTNTHLDTITRNSIFANTVSGIRIDPPANDSIAYPAIAGATTSAVTGGACTGCTVEVFIADNDPSGYGEGQTFIGSATADADGGFTAAVSGVTAGQKVTATATDPQGNTSQFALNVTVQTSGAPTVPLAPLLTDAAGSAAAVQIDWSAPSSDGGSPITNYKIYRGAAKGNETFLAQVGAIYSYTDSTVTNGTTYWYRVAAVNSVGEGLVSNEFSATPGSTMVSDHFERTVAAGFGPADRGGLWNVSSTTRTKVAGGEGVIYGWSGGNQDVQAWNSSATTDMEVLGLARLNATNPSGANYQVRIVARAQSDARNGYVARITHTTSGAANWALLRMDNGGGAGTLTLANGTLAVSGAAASRWWTRLVVQGTTVKVKWWREGSSEPGSWTATATDSYWSSGRTAVGVFVGAGLTTPFPDTGFDNVNAVDLSGTAPATVPGAPSLTSATAGDGSVALQWSAPASDGGAAITNYNVYRGTASGAETLLTQVGNTTSYTDSPVTNGTTYFYQVSAVNSVGEGALSNERSATPVAPGGPTVIVSDQFARTVAAGFGTADVGGPWNVSSTARTKVAGGQGIIYGWTGGGQDVQAWNPTVRTNMELVGLVQLNSTNPAGANYQARLVARAQSDARNGYLARITHTTAGGVTWALARTDNAGGTGSVTFASGTLLSSGGAGSRWWIRLRVESTSIKAKFWRDGTTEPVAWTATTTDSYWTSGRAALGSFVVSGITSPFPQVGFDNFEADDLG